MFWDAKFQAEKTSWGFEPAESAIRAAQFFRERHTVEILIPGIGYGRNARPFLAKGMHVTGIEISQQAISLAGSLSGSNMHVYHGSVTEMPYDQLQYDGIYCYALLHLLNKKERHAFVKNCHTLLNPGGDMVFVVVSVKASMFGKGRLLSHNRYEMERGLTVFFYDLESVEREFKAFGLKEVKEIDEPIRHMPNDPPLKCIYIRCKKPDNHNG